MTTHVILAKVGVKPTRVECRACSDVHAFKPRLVRRPAVTAGLSPEEAWTANMSQARGPSTAYTPGARFAVGMRLSHPSFGEGVVARLSSATVCEVIFSTRTVKLIMGPLAAEERLGGERVQPTGGARAGRRGRLHAR